MTSSRTDRLPTISLDSLREVAGGEDPPRNGTWVELHDMEGNPELFLPQTNWILGTPTRGERAAGPKRNLYVQTQSGNYYLDEKYQTVRDRLLGKTKPP